MSSTAFKYAADFVHRGVVLGLLSLVGYQTYQIACNVRTGVVAHPTQESTYFNQVNEKVREEYAKENQVDKRSSWYKDEDDKSYLKEQVRALPPKK